MASQEAAQVPSARNLNQTFTEEEVTTKPDQPSKAPKADQNEKDTRDGERDGRVSTENEEEGSDYITGLGLLLVTIAVTLMAFIMLLDTSIIITAIPRITSDFHSLNDISWYGSAYLLSSCALQPMTGKIYNQFRAKWAYMTFLGIFELGSILCATAQSSRILIIGRAIGGLGGAGIMNGCLVIISNCVPLHKRATYLGVLLSIAQLGVLFGPLLGGAFTEHASWRGCFYINIPIGAVVALLIVAIKIPDRSEKTRVKGGLWTLLHAFDIEGFILFAPSAIMLLLAIQMGGRQYDWGSHQVMGMICASAVIFSIFLLWEIARGDDAMIPPRVMGNWIVWMSCLFMMFFFSGVMMISYYLSVYFQGVRGFSPTISGAYALPSILPQILFAGVSGFAIDRTGYYLPWAIGCGILTSIGAGLLSTLTKTSGAAMWAGYQVIQGIGRGGGFQTPILAVQNQVPESLAAIGTATLMFFQTFGGAVALSVAQLAFDTGLERNLRIHAPGVPIKTVVAAGASRFREVIAPADLDGVIVSYNKAVQLVFYLATGVTVLTFLASLGMGWKSVKKAKPASADAVVASSGDGAV